MTFWRRSTMFWPYRPRAGYPSAPGWLTLLVLFGGVVLFFVALFLVGELAALASYGHFV
jgi:hypothetical protein